MGFMIFIFGILLIVILAICAVILIAQSKIYIYKNLILPPK